MERSTIAGIVAIMLVAGIAILGFSGSIVAYDWSDSEITEVEFTFNDTATAAYLVSGTTDNVTDAQTSITNFRVAGGHYDYSYNITDVTYVRLTITDPDNDEVELFLSPEGSWTYMMIGLVGNVTEFYQYGNYSSNTSYAFTVDGDYEFRYDQIFIINSTIWVSDTFTTTLYFHDAGTDDELEMGDLNLLTLTLGFIGLIGFVATPMATAKLMHGGDPIVVISAFLICMIMFGTFVYVFLLGGS